MRATEPEISEIFAENQAAQDEFYRGNILTAAFRLIEGGVQAKEPLKNSAFALAR